MRAVLRHVHGVERVLDASRRRPTGGTLVDRFVIVPWGEGQHSIQFELRDGDHVVHSSPTQQFKGARMAARAELNPQSGAAAELEPRIDRVARVSLQRSSVPQTEDEVLWMAIRRNSENLSFLHYQRFIEELLCPDDRDRGNREPRVDPEIQVQLQALAQRRALPFPGVDGYRWLKVATEVFVMATSGIVPDLDQRDVRETEHRTDTVLHGDLRDPDIALARYLGAGRHHEAMLPYHRIVMEKLQDARILRRKDDDGKIEACYGVLERKLRFPCMIELIWCYWQEEGMLVQTMHAISQRFQNRRATGERDPLAQLEVDPLRPLNNLLWGYLQDEGNSLTVLRRAHEYEHQYGISLQGKAVASLRPAESRSKFLESFHNLLYKCQQFYKQDDDATVIADGFPVLNAIKETHYLLAQGAHNQFGDLPATARQEMLIQQWLLGRPEMREFLGGRIMVPYPEPWMDRVDAMKTLKGWTDTGVVHFHDLATFGERLLLSIRYGAWSRINNRDHAANWARLWRTEIQGYIHAYRAVTGVDLASDPASVQNVEERYLPPSVHLRNRLALQRRR
ncbi:MAG: hypothetical protein E6J90_28085 [Deltaproteobacteria bacterium]|nr:MAG: hypothetical protein E6J90_28085 [Deltaproteobacteria bacterium]